MSGPNFRGAAPTGTPTSGGGTFVDGQGHVHYTTTLAEARKAAGFGTLLDKVGDVAPFAIMAGMGYGAMANAGVFGAAAAGHGATAAGPAVNWAAAPSASHLFAPTALVGTTAPAASTAAATGAGTGMSFGAGSLANFFNSRGGEAALNAGVTLVGGRMQANAYNRSAEVQAQAARDALAFEQEQYRAAQADYNAWLHGGPMARLDELIAAGRGSGAPGSPAPVNTTMPVPGQTMTYGQMRNAGSGQTPGAQQPGMVSVLSPNREEVRRFAPTDPKLAGHLQRGWTQV